jgi:hypothetical protein
MEFYRSQGYDEPTAAALAISEMGRRAPPDYSIQDPGYEGPTSAPLVQALQEQARTNPRQLAATRSSSEDLPGFDPTARDFNAQQAAEAAARMQQRAASLHQQMYGRSSAMSDEDVARAEGMATAGREAPRSRFDLSFRRAAPASAPTYSTESFREPERPSIVDQAVRIVERPTSAAARMAENIMQENQPSIVSPAAAAPAPQTSAAPAFPMDGSISGEAYGTPIQREVARAAAQFDNLVDPRITSAAVRPAARPAARPTPPMPLARPSDVSRGETPSFISRLFGGPEYQSTGDRVVKEGGQGVNFGSGESAADFFRADRELRKQRPEMFERQAEARGGAPKAASGAGGKDAALHKALEIIHHLLTRGR